MIVLWIGVRGEFREFSGMGWEEEERENDWGSGCERYWKNWRDGEAKNYLYFFFAKYILKLTFLVELLSSG